MHSAEEWKTIRDKVRPVVSEAAQHIRKNLSDLQVREKAPLDFVTNIDFEMEQYIVSALTEVFPEHRVVAEESFAGIKATEGLLWVVDPLDGTTNVVNNLPSGAVSLALLCNGAPVVAAVCDSFHEEFFDAVRGGGARLNGRPFQLDATAAARAPIALSSGFILWCETLPNGRPLLDLGRRYGKFRILGSQALQLCYVAAGRLRANISCEAKLWDDAAGALIIEEAGGWYRDFAGQAIFPIIAGSPAASGGCLRSLAAASSTVTEIVSILGQNG